MKQLIRVLMHQWSFTPQKAEEIVCYTLKPDSVKVSKKDVGLKDHPLFYVKMQGNEPRVFYIERGIEESEFWPPCMDWNGSNYRAIWAATCSLYPVLSKTTVFFPFEPHQDNYHRLF